MATSPFAKWLGWTYRIRPGKGFSVRITEGRQIVTFSHEGNRIAEIHFPRNGFEAAAGFADGLTITIDGVRKGLPRTYSNGKVTDTDFSHSAVIFWEKGAKTMKVATLRVRGFLARLIGSFYWQQMISEQRASVGEATYVRARREHRRQAISQTFNWGLIVLASAAAFIVAIYLVVTAGNVVLAPILQRLFGNWMAFPVP